MSFLLGLLLALIGMAVLATTQSKQAKLLFAEAPAGHYRLVLITTGSASLIACAWQTIFIYGLGVGVVTFLAHACFAAWIVSLFLTWRRERS